MKMVGMEMRGGKMPKPTKNRALTAKQRRQMEEYHRVMSAQLPKSDDLFANQQPSQEKKELHVNKICSECGHLWAHWSSDSGKTWQCKDHKK